MTPSLIALDWGTSSLRGYLLGESGEVLQSRHAERGILKVADGAFVQTYLEFCADWLTRYGDLPAIASGMIGSKQGWKEAPYVAAPASLGQVAVALTKVDIPGYRPLHIVPGVSYRDVRGLPDVMRGEETQLFGALAGGDGTRRSFVLPGTHSKWAVAGPSGIERFSTFMTGEVFAVLRAHSILGRLMPATSVVAVDDGFRCGADASLRGGGGGLLNRLFSTRTLGLFNDVLAAELASYLSGLLIGEEIFAARSAGLLDAASAVGIIADAALADFYRVVLEMADVRSVVLPADLAAGGLWRIAKAAGIQGRSRFSGR
ncbi:MAG: 2-dehydro-3-deoxygalactonokinase [Betaproteobacteria bacterium]